MNIGNLYAILWSVFLLVWLIGWLLTKRTQERAPFTTRLAYGVPITFGSYLIFAKNPALTRLPRLLPEGMPFETLALVLTVSGLAVAIWARFYLGKNWSGAVTIKVGHELIRRGPYRWVRHPIYSGLLLALLGTALRRGRVVDLFAVPLFALGFWIKIRQEERFMRKTFGEQYTEYGQSTGALVPRLYS